MRRKIILGSILAVVAAVIIIVVSVVTITGGKSGKKLAKDFSKALKSESKIENFVDKKMDVKTFVAVTNALIAGHNDTFRSDVKEQLDNLVASDIKDAKEDAKEFLLQFVDEKEPYRFKSITSMKSFDEAKDLKYQEVTYRYDGLDQVFTFLYYNNKLIYIIDGFGEDFVENYIAGDVDTTIDYDDYENEIYYDRSYDDNEIDNEIDEDYYDPAYDYKEEYDFIRHTAGEKVTGADLKSILDKVIEIEEEGAIIRVVTRSVAGYENADALEDAGEDAFYDLDTKSLDKYEAEINNLKTKIDDTKNYKVIIKEAYGTVQKIIISEVK